MAPVKIPQKPSTAAEAPKFIVNRPDSGALERLLAEGGMSLPAVVIRLAWQLGLLRREIHQLTWGQVDFTASVVRLEDRAIPMEPEIQVFLQRLLTGRKQGEGPVVLSDRGGRQPAEQHLSYVCRKALDAAGQPEVRLLDLRYDYILRQLQRHDWQYVSRVSGLDPRTLQLHFAESWQERRMPAQPRAAGAVDAEKVRAVLESEGASACGTALRLVWQMGLYQEELLQLRWDMIDWQAQQVRLPGRTVPLNPALIPFLQALQEQNRADSGLVLISDRARRPMESAYISKAVRAALIRGGCDNLTLRDLRRDWEMQSRYEGPVLEYLGQHRRMMRSQAMALLHLTEDQANARLRRMVERGTLIRSGHCYYLPGSVVAPEQQRDVILAYLSNHAGCQRKHLAKLLGLEPKQCLTILERLIKSKEIRRVGTRYYPGGL